jgi:transcription antitermination protein NusB
MTVMAGGVARHGGRSAARRRALDILYEADVLDQPIAVVLARWLHRAEEPGGGDQPRPDPYTVELVQGVDRLGEDLDARIRAAAEHWRLERMPLVDRNILRLGVYELLERGEVPTSVVVSEAVELAKLLSTDDSGRFVNGVLGAIARTVRRPTPRR